MDEMSPGLNGLPKLGTGRRPLIVVKADGRKVTVINPIDGEHYVVPDSVFKREELSAVLEHAG